ncbi:hypothetical protein BU23DRAFT_31552 [Bimuria novae-zelandiae CBS 107.79]|uniref:Uncharacterized protein n=1 Tax=Bimuria novae-zelandiae CBS 107.79 TaxID=1447943 RepID=A0A6A5VJ40_9PLEO|nr:hypothetical protein BU23DRAFT_31552 [Bimuria novae-zelandiae CBS 107.79]
MSAQYAPQPYHMDDFGGRHYPPQPHSRVPPPSSGRPRGPRYDGTQGRGDRRPRAQTYRAPPAPTMSTSSNSPPPRRHLPRRSPRNHEVSTPGEDYYAPRRRRHRDEDYFSDNCHDRRHVPRDRHRERDAPAPNTRERDDRAERRSALPRTERQEKKWQKEGKRFFNEYAVPAIKAEGTKYISKQLGNILAKGVS